MHPKNYVILLQGLRVSFVRVESGVDPLALRDARLRLGLTQHELARLIDVAGGERISRWGLGSSAPRAELRHRLAEALNVGVADLLEAGGRLTCGACGRWPD